MWMNSRASPGEQYVPTAVEHMANVITHGAIIVPSLARRSMWAYFVWRCVLHMELDGTLISGFNWFKRLESAVDVTPLVIVPSGLGLLWMLYLAVDTVQYTIAIIYGLALLALFTVSTSFHCLCYTGKCRSMKDVLHIGDRAIIYIFIAASYTPWLVLKPFHDDSHGTTMLCVVWIAAVFGIGYQYTFHERYKWLETLFYVAIGVLPSAVVAGVKDDSGIHELALGGAIYILGVVFFKCDGVIPFAHAIWHCFVLGGALLHFLAVCNHLLGAENRLELDLHMASVKDEL